MGSWKGRRRKGRARRSEGREREDEIECSVWHSDRCDSGSAHWARSCIGRTCEDTRGHRFSAIAVRQYIHSRLPDDGHRWTLHLAPDRLFQSLVRAAVLVVVPHVVEGLEVRVRHDVVASGPRVRDRLVRLRPQDVRLAVLVGTSVEDYRDRGRLGSRYLGRQGTGAVMPFAGSDRGRRTRRGWRGCWRLGRL